MPKPTQNILILGPQGSGKGTQAGLLAEKFHLMHVETGKMFRRIAKQPTPLSRRVNVLMNKKGALIPDNLVNRLLWESLRKIKRTQGIIFDGYPRSLAQARALTLLLRKLGRQVTTVINMPISRSTTVRRLSLRRTCMKCGRIFIAGVSVPAQGVTCPVCRGALIQREDDKPHAIARRLAIYNRLTKPVIGYYRKQGVLVTVSGEPTIKVVLKNILKIFHYDQDKKPR